jgi:hypothetical protein
MTVSVDPPNRKPWRTSIRQARTVSISATCTTSSTTDSSSSGGRTLVPRPGSIRGWAGVPKVTEPMLSIATIRTDGRFSRKYREQPMSVPVLPAPMNSTSTSGKLLRISGPVVR